MKRFAHLLLRVYPKAWRERYGEEIGAVIEDAPVRWTVLPDLARGAIKEQLNMQSFTRLVGWMSVAGLAAGFAASFAVTPRYTSQAVISLPGAGAADIVSLADADLTSRQALAILINDPARKLYAEEKRAMPMEDVEDLMRRDLNISADRTTVRIVFSYRDPAIARSVVSAVVHNLATYVAKPPYHWAYFNGRELGYVAEIERLESAIALLEGTARSSTIRILDQPSLPTHSDSPNRAAFAAYGFFSGIVAAFLTALTRRRPHSLPCPS